MYRWLTVQTIFTFICFQYETGQTGKHRPKDVSKKKNKQKQKLTYSQSIKRKTFLSCFFCLFLFVCLIVCLLLFCSVLLMLPTHNPLDKSK